MALTTSGMVMNGPTPIMSIMFSAVALPSPIPRMRVGEAASDFVGKPMCRLDYAPRYFPSALYWQLGTGNWLLLLTQQIHIQPHGSRHARWQLPEKCISGVDIHSLPVLCPQQPAFLRILSRIVAGQQRLKMIIPLAHEI